MPTSRKISATTAIAPIETKAIAIASPVIPPTIAPTIAPATIAASAPPKESTRRRVVTPLTVVCRVVSGLAGIAVKGINGAPLDLGRFAGRALLVVNVASKCGLTPQYEGLQRLHERYRDRGFSVLGVPCNQFAGQEPGTPQEVAEFCSTTYAVTFPLTEKLEVNGRRRHPLYRELAATPDGDGEAGDVRWNFEKFLISPAGEVLARFRPQTEPESDELMGAIERVLPAPADATWEARAAEQVRPGERIRLDDGTEMTVARVDAPFLGMDGLLCVIEDSEARWLARPMALDARVEVLGSR